jgi:Photosynthesis system II assembly factor YCF48
MSSAVMVRASALLAASLAMASTGCDALFGVDFSAARPDGTTSGAGGGGGSGGSEVGWSVLPLPVDSDHVTAIHCETLDRCVVATEGADFAAGRLYAATLQEVVGIVFEGDSIVDGVSFTRLMTTPSGPVALIDRAEPLVMADEDFTSPSAWRTVDAGDLGNFEGALNPQLWFQHNANGSQLGLRGAVLAANSPPGPLTDWETTWSPPSIPSNYLDLVLADDTICRSAPSGGRGPVGFASDDLEQIVFPVGNGFDDDPDRPGACVSLDAGVTFRHAELPDGEVAFGGPHGLRCNDVEHCWAFGDGGVTEPSHLYRSTSSLTVGMDWVRAAIPEGPERTLRDVAFAPDNLHGWLVGTEAPGRGLVLATEDGGATWSDNLVADHPAFEGAELRSVFALDDRHIWVGGEDGLLMSSDRGGR